MAEARPCIEPGCAEPRALNASRCRAHRTRYQAAWEKRKRRKAWSQVPCLFCPEPAAKHGQCLACYEAPFKPCVKCGKATRRHRVGHCGACYERLRKQGRAPKLSSPLAIAEMR